MSANVDKLRETIKQDNKERTDLKTKNNQEWEKWKQGKRQRLAQADKKIDDLKLSIDKIWADYNESKEAYWKQKNLIDFI